MYKVTLEAARVNAGLNQTQVAKKIGVGLTTICRWETGKSKPPIDKMLKMCELYGVPVEMIKFQEV